MAQNNSDNQFSVYRSNSGLVQFLESSINTTEEVIAHYDFVIKDISSNISNPELEATKGPALAFLKAKKREWETFQAILKILRKEQSGKY